MSGREWSRAHVNGHRKRKIGVLLNRCFSYEGRVTRGVSEKGHTSPRAECRIRVTDRVALVSWLLDLVAACFATGSSCAAVSSPDEGGRGAQANSRRRTAAAAPFFFQSNFQFPRV